MNPWIKGIMFTLIVLATIYADGRVIRIAVVDTGYDTHSTWPFHKSYQPKAFCGVYDALADKYNSDIPDEYNHGTSVVSVLSKYLNDHNVDYCVYLIKFLGKTLNISAYIKALSVAKSVHPDIVNISAAGLYSDKLECDIIKDMLDEKIIVVAAVGNEHMDLSVTPFFPAMCDDRVIKVENVDRDGMLYISSNYNSKPIPNVVKELGVAVEALMPNNQTGFRTGTSFSVPLYCAKRAEKMFKEAP